MICPDCKKTTHTGYYRDGRYLCRDCAPAAAPRPVDLHTGTGTNEPGDTMAYKRYCESLAVAADGRTPVFAGTDREAPY